MQTKEIKQIYWKTGLLGEGSSGKVYLIEKIQDAHKMVQKEVPIQNKTEEEIIQVFSEVKFLEVLRHPNIINILDVFKTHSNKLAIILEYANQGTLQHQIDKLQQNNRRFSENKILEIFTQILLGLKFSHDHQIIHRDLKAENIFIKDNKIKIGDYGVSKLIKDRNSISLSQVLGTPVYFAPEIFQGSKYDFKLDIWALGVILYQLMYLELPFIAKDYVDLMSIVQNNMHKHLSHKYSQKLRDIIDACLEKDPSKWPSVNQILNQDLIREYICTSPSLFECILVNNNSIEINWTNSEILNAFQNVKQQRNTEFRKSVRFIKDHIWKSVNLGPSIESPSDDFFNNFCVQQSEIITTKEKNEINSVMLTKDLKWEQTKKKPNKNNTFYGAIKQIHLETSKAINKYSMYLPQKIQKKIIARQ